MARWAFLFLVAVLAPPHAAAAGVLPGDNGLTDQKNFSSVGGVGSYAGVGDSGIPFGGGGDVGGLRGLGEFRGAGGEVVGSAVAAGVSEYAGKALRGAVSAAKNAAKLSAAAELVLAPPGPCFILEAVVLVLLVLH